jgi:polyisoprenoid-binding protein YceI
LYHLGKVLSPHFTRTFLDKETLFSMRKYLGLAVAVLSLCSAALAADEFKIDPNHSSVNFSVSHAMGISTVVGRFTQFEGKITFDDKDVTKSAVSVSIKTDSINTDVQRRDEDLRNNYFEVAKFPEITFQSKSVEKKGNDYVAHGTLTIHGVSIDVDLPFEFKGPVDAGQGRGKVMGAHAGLTVNRLDFGVGKATPMIGSDVKIDLYVEARMAPPASAPGK